MNLKNWTLPLVLGILIVAGCTSKSIAPGFKIIGNIEDLRDGKVYLCKYVNENWEPVDSTVSQEGSFKFTGLVDLPEMYRIKINDTLPQMAIFVENDEINLSGMVDSLSNYKIAGSKSHEEYEAFWGKQKIYSVRMDSLEKEAQTAGMNKDNKKTKAVETEMENLWNAQIESIRQHVISNNKSVVSAYLAWSRLPNNCSLAQLEEVTHKLDTSLNQSIYMVLLKNFVSTMKKLEVGQPAIDFTMASPNGDSIKLSSLYGKYLLVDFWASWCSPCRGENPNVVKAYKKYKNKRKGFDILGVSLDEQKANWTKAIQDDKLAWHHVSDLKGWANEVARLYGIRSIPSNILLDPKGIIIGKNLRGEDLDKKLKELLK